MGQAIVTARFYFYGKRHFTATGWKANSAFYKEGELEAANFQGRVAVVTGANSGIGREVTQYLASRGSTVYMVCRNAERGEEERSRISESTGCKSVHVLVADCGVAADVRRVAAELRAKESCIHCLVCNAGAITPTRTLTSEGHEVTFATQLLNGTYLLTEELRPLLSKGDGSRVVVVSSGGMLNVKYDHARATGAKGSYDRQLAYAYAKRGQVLLCEHWGKDPKQPIAFLSCHPGWVDTPGVDHAYGSMKSYLQPLRNSWQGAEGIMWLCVAPRDQLQSGAFYLDRKPQDKHLVSWTQNTDADVQAMVKALATAAVMPST